MKSMFFALIVLIFSQSAFAKVSWHYTAFPYVKKNAKIKLSEPEALRVGKKVLHPIMSRQSGTHRYWRVEQLFLSKDLKKKVFVKYNVGLSSKDPIGGWIKLKKAHVLHLKKGKDIVAYMAQGFNNFELYELQKQLSQSSKKVAEVIWNPFINCAHAEVTSNPAGDGWGYSEEQWTPAEEPTSPSMLERAANVAKCVGGETLEKVKDAGKQLWENATLENAWEAVPSREEIKNGAIAAWNAIPTWEETKQGAAAAWDTVTNLDPEAVVEGISNAWDHSTQLIAGIYQKVKDVVVGFANLTADVADYLICQITSFLIQEGSMNAAMSVLTGGGALGLAMAKMTASIVRFSEKLKPLMPAFMGLSKASLSSSERLEKAEKIMKGELSEDELTRLSGDTRNPTNEGITTANAGQTIADKIAELRGLSVSEKELMLKASGQLSDSGRVSAASNALGRPISKTESEALLRAHEVAPERGYNSYTQADLREKTRILREAGYSQQEADLLMRRGLAGQMDPSGNGNLSFASIRQEYLSQNPGIRDSYGNAPRLGTMDVGMDQVPFFAQKIRSSLDRGGARPATDAEASRLGEILLRDFARTAQRGSNGQYSPGKDQTEKLQTYLEKLGYPASSNGLGWPLNSPGAMEGLERVPTGASATYLYEKKATGLLAVGQITKRISVLSDPIARRGLDISESEARSEISELMARRNQIDRLIGIIDSQTSK